MAEADRSGSAAAWKRIVGYLGGLAVGVVLLVGALTKAVDPEAFVEQIGAQGLDFFLSARAVAFVALGVELGLGTALLLGLRRLWVLVPALFLVVFFLFLTGRSYWNSAHGVVDESVSCGCFGNLVDRTPAEAFWQDLLLMGPALLVGFVGRLRETSIPTYRLATVALVTVGGLVLAWKAPALPLDDLATRLKPGRSVDLICAGGDEARVCLSSLVPELQTGDYVVVLADLTSPDFGEAVQDLNRHAMSGRGPTLWVLSASSPEEHLRFFWQRAPAFEIRDAPRSLLRPLYRALPRSFLVSGGKVTHTFSGLPPPETLSGSSEPAPEKDLHNGSTRSLRL